MERVTGMTDPDDWASTPAPVQANPDPVRHAERTAEAQETFSQSVYAITQAITDLHDSSALVANDALERLAYGELAESIAWIQDTRRALGLVESYLSRELGRDEGCPDSLVLPSGRHADVMKGKDRKAWDHEAWQRDVRQAVMFDAAIDESAIVDERTGESQPATAVVAPLLAAVQAAHGSTAPKVRALKALRLDADDYCETYPGPFSVKVSPPPTENIATTTTGA